mgnify:CR=1 FL=1
MANHFYADHVGRFSSLESVLDSIFILESGFDLESEIDSELGIDFEIGV